MSLMKEEDLVEHISQHVIDQNLKHSRGMSYAKRHDLKYPRGVLNTIFHLSF